MLFNSYVFWFFFGCVFIMYWSVPKKLQNTVLLLSSYCFYGAWDWRFLSLIFISTIVDFIVAKKIIDNPNKKKYFLIFSIITNLGILGVFKYLRFFIDQFNELFLSIGLNSLLPTFNIIIPVGISFYTFQTLSYTIDVYQNKSKPIKNLLDFALYVSFFPQLVAGPIERSYRLLPQIIKPRYYKDINFQECFYYIIYGLFLKVVLADNMAVIVNGIYSQDSSNLLGSDILVATYAFAFQIYGDFSGYSMIAIGLGKCFGINLMRNFKAPYLSKNPSEFWQRWHISLSTWLKDYLYISLGGNRKGRLFTYRNLLLTMLIGGLWHGVGWTYVVWGGFHGLILILYRFSIIDLKMFLNKQGRYIYIISQKILMFHLICISWVFFRSETINYALNLLTKIIFEFHFTAQSFSMFGLIIFFALPIFLYEAWDDKRNFKNFEKRPTMSLIILLNYCFFMILIFPAPTHQEFIYFQF